MFISREAEEDHVLLLEAYERLEKHRDEPSIPMADVMAHHGISESDLDEIEDVKVSNEESLLQMNCLDCPVLALVLSQL